MPLDISKIKLVVLDFDGVIADTGMDIAAAVKETQKNYGIEPWEKEKILSFVGHGAKYLIKNTVAYIDETKLEEMLRWYCDYYIEHTTVYTEFYPGVREFFQETEKQGIKLCVLTNKPERQTNKILEELDGLKYFSLIVGPESIGKLKPDPEGLFYCMNRLGIKQDETVMVGDSYSDIVTGKAGGTHTCGVLYGIGNVQKLLEEGPEVCVEKDLREMFGI